MEFVEQLKSSVDIVNVIGEYVRLRKVGARYVGLCPFHNEKTPSFNVNSIHQFYKCFGCGAAGDVLQFVMDVDHLSFYEALKLIAERNGIPMPKRSEYSDPETKLRAAIFQMHELADQVFREQLAGPGGKEARSYLQERGLKSVVIEQFGLGYSEPSGRALVRIFEKQGFNAQQMEASGLVRKRDDGTFYDGFRNRLMFPIHNESGKIIAFAGRALKTDEEPKYLNSPKTPIYEKKYVLYNLHRAKEGLRKSDRAILVEGYMDVIGVFGSGVHEVVACCGTSLTAQHIQVLRRLAGKIVVNFDPDAAGVNAAERFRPLLEEGFPVSVVELDGGLDPDEYCREHGAEAYCEKLANAKTYFHWLAERARKKFDMRTPEGRVAGFQFLLPEVQRLPDKIARAAVANDVAGYLGVEANLVLENFRKAAIERREKTVQAPPEPIRPDEKILLNLLLSNAEARERLIPELKAMPAVEKFASRRVFELLFALYDSGAHVAFGEIHARLEENDRALLASAVLADETNEGSLSLQQGIACLRSLENSDWEMRKSLLKAQIRDAERSGNITEVLKCNEELNRMRRM